MKKNQQRLIESLQASLEAESRSKAEVIRTKKKLETDIQELENSLDHASRVIAFTVYSGLQSGTLFKFFIFGQDCIQNRTLFATEHYYSKK